jgi:hypothetical protein
MEFCLRPVPDLRWVVKLKRTPGDFMEYAAFVFGILGLVAFVRVEKLVKTLKEQGVLDQDYKEE